MFRAIRIVASVVVVWLLVGWGVYEMRGNWSLLLPLVTGGVLGVLALFVSGRMRRYINGVMVTVILCGIGVVAALVVSLFAETDPKMSAFLGFVGFFCVGVTGEVLRYWRRRRRTTT